MTLVNQTSDTYTVQTVLGALNQITKGRIITHWADIPGGKNSYVMTKTSHIPGKSVIEMPGLVFGKMEAPVTRVGVAMTLTESVIELASALNLELLVIHHPVAEAASSGGVPFAHYLPLYNIAIAEVHEAFHGLHPGITFLHGHQVHKTDTSFAGIPGNVLHVGITFDDIQTAGDILFRLNQYIGCSVEQTLLYAEQQARGIEDLQEATLANPPRLLNGTLDSPVKNVLHFFPHTGFTREHLQEALKMYPETDTLIASISRVRPNHPLVEEAKQRNLTFLVGNPHSVEILENGLPLAHALDYLLPGLDVFVLRDRVTASLLEMTGHSEIREYGREMAMKYLVETTKDATTTPVVSK